jgi:hypothetical protein
MPRLRPGPWLGRSLRLGIAPDGLALVCTSPWPHEPALLLDQVRFDDAAAANVVGMVADAVAALAGAHDCVGWPVTVVLADDMARLWQVAPPLGSTTMADLEGAAALRFAQLYGDDPGGWRIAADWDADAPFLAAALPRALLGGLEAAAGARRFHLVGVAPQLVAALNGYRRRRRAGAWFGLVHGGVLSLVLFDGARLAAVRTAPIPDGADRDWLEGHVAREALRTGLGRPERLQVCGPAPRGWASSAGRLKFACTLFEDGLPPLWPDTARLAMTGRAP